MNVILRMPCGAWEPRLHPARPPIMFAFYTCSSSGRQGEEGQTKITLRNHSHASDGIDAQSNTRDKREQRKKVGAGGKNRRTELDMRGIRRGDVEWHADCRNKLCSRDCRNKLREEGVGRGGVWNGNREQRNTCSRDC